MATTTSPRETIELYDGTKIEVRPLKIKQLRKFMEAVEKFQAVDNEADSLDIMIEAAGIALEPFAPDIAADPEQLEEQLDIPTIWKLLEVAGGIQQGNQIATTGLAGRR